MKNRDQTAENNLKPYLEKLEEMIDLGHVQRTRHLQRRAFAFEPVEHIPTAISFPVSEDEWPNYGFLEIFDDPAKMLLHELREVYIGAKLQDDQLYGIRANYGTGIIASMFGCETRTFEDSLPIGLPVSHEQLDRILDRGIPDLNCGVMGRVLETAAYFREKLCPYPKLSQTVGSQMFDIQGPFDNASIIWGAEIYLAFFEAPEKFSKLIRLITETILAAAKKLREVDGCDLGEHGGQWNFLGGLCVRNDTSVNLSGDHYLEFVKQYDARLLEESGGWVHFCGRAHQWWQHLLDIPNLKGINPYQGEFYDLYEMYKICKSAKISIVQWTSPVNARCRARIRTGFSRIIRAPDFDTARRLKDILYSTGHVDND